MVGLFVLVIVIGAFVLGLLAGLGVISATLAVVCWILALLALALALERLGAYSNVRVTR